MCSLPTGQAQPTVGGQEAEGRESPMPLELLERRICEGAADLAAATCRWLRLVAEFDARNGWAEWGVNSCAHWLSWRCGIGVNTAREQIRVARALTSLPLLTAAFASGELSYSKVRAVTRVAQPETEAQLVEIARFATGAVLEKVVSGYAGVIRATREQAETQERKQRLSCHWDDDGMLRIEGRLRTEDGARFLQALEGVRTAEAAALSHEARRAQALMYLTCAGDPAGTELVVHVDADTLAQETITDRCEVQEGLVIAPETARRLGCDAGIRTMVERGGAVLAVGRRTRTVSPALNRALQSRDAGCRFPGCTNTRFLQAHHIHHWAAGGPTELDNLVRLCTHHHRLVHEGGYRVQRDTRDVPRFFNPQGRVIPAAGEYAQASSLSIDVRNAQVGVHVDADTCRPLTPGDRCDYDLAVAGLARTWLPDPP